jgi:hypothetical protein
MIIKQEQINKLQDKKNLLVESTRNEQQEFAPKRDNKT